MGVVANVEVKVDSRGAVSSLDAVKGAALKLAAAYGTLQAAQKAINAGIARIESERRLEFLSKGYGEVEKLSKAAAEASIRFGQSQTTANKSLADVYARLRPVGTSLEDIVSVYNGFNTAARISGSTAVESENAFRQLSQALGSGALRGDEFNSVSEQVPGILTAISKETGIAQGKLRAYAAEGKITSDVIIGALQRIEEEGAGQLAEAIGGPEQAIRDFENSVEEIRVSLTKSLIPELAQGFRDLAAIIASLEPEIKHIGSLISGALKEARALIEIVKGTSVVERLRQGGQLGFDVAGEEAELQAFLGEKRLKQLKDQAMQTSRLSEGELSYRAALEETLRVAIQIKDEKNKIVQAQKESTTEAGSTSEKLKAAAEAQARLTENAKTFLEATKNNTVALENQLITLQGNASIEAARIQSLQALNDLERTRLGIAYEQAETAQAAYNIAIKLFDNAVNAANLEAKAKLTNIELTQQSLALQAKIQDAKVLEIKAEGELQKLKAQSIDDDAKRAKKISEITEKTNSAVRAQLRVAEETRKQIEIQQEVARYQAEAVEAVRQGKIETAAQGLEQRLVSEKIKMSSERAEELVGGLRNTAIESGKAATSSNTLSTGLRTAAGNAEQTATMMIRVATEADRAAVAIQRAAAAQAQLRAAQQAAPAPAQPATGAADGAYWPGGFKAFANGGVVNKPTLGLVGEGGESEYIIPASKMAEAMQRYGSGMRGNGVIPGKGGDGDPGMMGSINPVVNVTTGPVMNMDGQNYITQNDFVAGLQSASTRGAEMAMQMITSSGGARRRLGVG